MFPNGECIIDDEEKFLEHFQINFPQIIPEDIKLKELINWQPTIMRIFERVEFRMNCLKELKQSNYTDSRNLEVNERSLHILTEALKEIFTEINDVQRISLPFIEQLLGLTSDAKVIGSLVQISLQFISEASYHFAFQDHIINLFQYLSPFAKVLHYFNHDFKKVHDALLEQTSEGKFHGLPSIQLKEGFGACLKYGEAAYKILEEDPLLLRCTSQTEFVHRLLQKINEGQPGQENNNNILSGEIFLISFFLRPQRTQDHQEFIPVLIRIHNFLGRVMQMLV